MNPPTQNQRVARSPPLGAAALQMAASGTGGAAGAVECDIPGLTALQDPGRAASFSLLRGGAAGEGAPAEEPRKSATSRGGGPSKSVVADPNNPDVVVYGVVAPALQNSQTMELPEQSLPMGEPYVLLSAAAGFHPDGVPQPPSPLSHHTSGSDDLPESSARDTNFDEGYFILVGQDWGDVLLHCSSDLAAAVEEDVFTVLRSVGCTNLPTVHSAFEEVKQGVRARIAYGNLSAPLSTAEKSALAQSPLQNVWNVYYNFLAARRVEAHSPRGRLHSSHCRRIDGTTPLPEWNDIVCVFAGALWPYIAHRYPTEVYSAACADLDLALAGETRAPTQPHELFFSLPVNDNSSSSSRLRLLFRIAPALLPANDSVPEIRRWSNRIKAHKFPKLWALYQLVNAEDDGGIEVPRRMVQQHITTAILESRLSAVEKRFNHKALARRASLEQEGNSVTLKKEGGNLSALSRPDSSMYFYLPLDPEAKAKEESSRMRNRSLSPPPPPPSPLLTALQHSTRPVAQVVSVPSAPHETLESNKSWAPLPSILSTGFEYSPETSAPNYDPPKSNPTTSVQLPSGPCDVLIHRESFDSLENSTAQQAMMPPKCAVLDRDSFGSHSLPSMRPPLVEIESFRSFSTSTTEEERRERERAAALLEAERRRGVDEAEERQRLETLKLLRQLEAEQASRKALEDLVKKTAKERDTILKDIEAERTRCQQQEKKRRRKVYRFFPIKLVRGVVQPPPPPPPPPPPLPSAPHLPTLAARESMTSFDRLPTLPTLVERASFLSASVQPALPPVPQRPSLTAREVFEEVTDPLQRLEHRRRCGGWVAETHRDALVRAAAEDVAHALHLRRDEVPEPDVRVTPGGLGLDVDVPVDAHLSRMDVLSQLHDHGYPGCRRLLPPPPPALVKAASAKAPTSIMKELTPRDPSPVPVVARTVKRRLRIGFEGTEWEGLLEEEKEQFLLAFEKDTDRTLNVPCAVRVHRVQVLRDRVVVEVDVKVRDRTSCDTAVRQLRGGSYENVWCFYRRALETSSSYEETSTPSSEPYVVTTFHRVGYVGKGWADVLRQYSDYFLSAVVQDIGEMLGVDVNMIRVTGLSFQQGAVVDFYAAHLSSWSETEIDAILAPQRCERVWGLYREVLLAQRAARRLVAPHAAAERQPESSPETIAADGCLMVSSEKDVRGRDSCFCLLSGRDHGAVTAWSAVSYWVLLLFLFRFLFLLCFSFKERIVLTGGLQVFLLLSSLQRNFQIESLTYLDLETINVDGGFRVMGISATTSFSSLSVRRCIAGGCAPGPDAVLRPAPVALTGSSITSGRVLLHRDSFDSLSISAGQPKTLAAALPHKYTVLDRDSFVSHSVSVPPKRPPLVEIESFRSFSTSTTEEERRERERAAALLEAERRRGVDEAEERQRLETLKLLRQLEAEQASRMALEDLVKKTAKEREELLKKFEIERMLRLERERQRKTFRFYPIRVVRGVSMTSFDRLPTLPTLVERASFLSASVQPALPPVPQRPSLTAREVFEEVADPLQRLEHVSDVVPGAAPLWGWVAETHRDALVRAAAEDVAHALHLRRDEVPEPDVRVTPAGLGLDVDVPVDAHLSRMDVLSQLHDHGYPGCRPWRRFNMKRPGDGEARHCTPSEARLSTENGLGEVTRRWIGFEGTEWEGLLQFLLAFEKDTDRTLPCAVHRVQVLRDRVVVEVDVKVRDRTSCDTAVRQLRAGATLRRALEARDVDAGAVCCNDVPPRWVRGTDAAVQRLSFAVVQPLGRFAWTQIRADEVGEAVIPLAPWETARDLSPSEDTPVVRRAGDGPVEAGNKANAITSAVAPPPRGPIPCPPALATAPAVRTRNPAVGTHPVAKPTPRNNVKRRLRIGFEGTEWEGLLEEEKEQFLLAFEKDTDRTLNVPCAVRVHRVQVLRDRVVVEVDVKVRDRTSCDTAVRQLRGGSYENVWCFYRRALETSSSYEETSTPSSEPYVVTTFHRVGYVGKGWADVLRQYSDYFLSAVVQDIGEMLGVDVNMIRVTGLSFQQGAVVDFYAAHLSSWSETEIDAILAPQRCERVWGLYREVLLAQRAARRLVAPHAAAERQPESSPEMSSRISKDTYIFIIRSCFDRVSSFENSCFKRCLVSSPTALRNGFILVPRLPNGGHVHSPGHHLHFFAGFFFFFALVYCCCLWSKELEVVRSRGKGETNTTRREAARCSTMEPVNSRQPDSMDGFARTTHQVPIRPQWNYILDRRRNEALSAFRYDIAAFLRVPLDDVTDILVRPEANTIQFTVKYTALLTPGDVDTILRGCEYHEMTLLVYDSYYPDGFDDDASPRETSPNPVGLQRAKKPKPRDPTQEDRAYRMYFPGKYWEEVMKSWSGEAEIAARNDILEVLQATEIIEKPPEIPMRFKCEPDGMWLVYSVEDDRSTRRAARRDFFARNTFSQLWALYAERSAADPGWMTKGEARKKKGTAPVPLIPSSMDPNRNLFPAIASEDPDGEIIFPGSLWPELLERRMKDLRKAGKTDVANVMEDHGETFHGPPHIKVRFEAVQNGAKMMCKILNAAALAPAQVEARRRMLGGYHYPMVMKLYDNYVSVGRKNPRGAAADAGDTNQKKSAFQLPSLMAASIATSPRRSGFSPQASQSGRRNSTPQTGGRSRGYDSPRASMRGRSGSENPNEMSYTGAGSSQHLQMSLMEYDDVEGDRPSTYRCRFPGSQWKRVVRDHRSKLYQAAIADVQNCLMQKERLQHPPTVDVTFTLRKESKGLRAFFTFRDEAFRKPTKQRHESIQTYDFPLLWGLYATVREAAKSEGRGRRSNSSSPTQWEVERSMSLGSFQTAAGPAGSSAARPSPKKEDFLIPLGEPGVLPNSPKNKGLELRIPFPDVHWRETLTLERAAEVDLIVRKDIQSILVRVGALTENTTELPCIISTFVPVGNKGAMLYIKFSRRDRRVLDKTRHLLMDPENYTQLRALCNSKRPPSFPMHDCDCDNDEPMLPFLSLLFLCCCAALGPIEFIFIFSFSFWFSLTLYVVPHHTHCLNEHFGSGACLLRLAHPPQRVYASIDVPTGTEQYRRSTRPFCITPPRKRMIRLSYFSPFPSFFFCSLRCLRTNHISDTSLRLVGWHSVHNPIGAIFFLDLNQRENIYYSIYRKEAKRLQKCFKAQEKEKIN
eukprot:gene10646-7394_t